MKHVPASGFQSVVAERFVIGRAPDIRRHAVFLGQNGLRTQGFVDERATAKNVGVVFSLFGGGFEFIKALQNAFLRVFRHWRHGVFPVVRGEIVKRSSPFSYMRWRPSAMMVATSNPKAGS